MQILFNIFFKYFEKKIIKNSVPLNEFKGTLFLMRKSYSKYVKFIGEWLLGYWAMDFLYWRMDGRRIGFLVYLKCKKAVPSPLMLVKRDAALFYIEYQCVGGTSMYRDSL